MVLWLRADSRNKLSEAYASFAVKLGLLKELQDQSWSRKVVLKWLADPVKVTSSLSDQPGTRARWLIIFDNADDPDVLQEFWPKVGNGSIILTTRRPISKSDLSTAVGMNIPSIELMSFNKQEASEYLSRLAKHAYNPQHPEAAEEIAERLAGLPLALKQIGIGIARREMSFSQFIHVYDRLIMCHARWHTSYLPSKTEEYEHNLATVWNIETLDGEALTLLRVMSFLDPDSILESLLQTETEIKVGAYPRDLDAYYEARSALRDSSLVNINQEDQELSIHRIIQDVTRGKIKDQPDLQDCFAFATHLVKTAWPFKDRIWGYTSKDIWEACDKLNSHTICLSKLYSDYQTSYLSILGFESFARLLVNCGWYVAPTGI